MTNLYIQKVDSNGNTISIYTMTNSQTFEPDYSAPVSPMPLPQNDDTQNILIKIEGNSSQITETWTMNKQATNNASPTTDYAGFVAITGLDSSALPLTPFDQVLFFKKFILPTQITDRYILTVADKVKMGTPTAGVYTPTFTNVLYQELGTITGLKPAMTGDSPVAFSATLTFMVGNVVSAYEVNTPSAPQSFAATVGAGGSHTINLSWADPDDKAGGITSFKIYRNLWNTIPTLLTTIVGDATFTYADSNTTSGKTYYYTIYATNSQGLGGPSAQISAVSP